MSDPTDLYGEFFKPTPEYWEARRAFGSYLMETLRSPEPHRLPSFGPMDRTIIADKTCKKKRYRWYLTGRRRRGFQFGPIDSDRQRKGAYKPKRQRKVHTPMRTNRYLAEYTRWGVHYTPIPGLHYPDRDWWSDRTTLLAWIWNMDLHKGYATIRFARPYDSGESA